MTTHRWVIWNKVKGFQAIGGSTAIYSHSLKRADMFISRKSASCWSHYGDTVRKVTVTIED